MGESGVKKGFCVLLSMKQDLNYAANPSLVYQGRRKIIEANMKTYMGILTSDPFNFTEVFKGYVTLRTDLMCQV